MAAAGGVTLDMVGRGCFDFPHTKRLPALIFGLMLAFCTTFSSHIHASTDTRVASVKCRNLSSTHQHCVIHPDGVHDLDCFGGPSQKPWRCEWKPGRLASEKTYTLVIKQPRRRLCRLYPNITALSQTIQIYTNSNLSAEVFENSPSTNCTRAPFTGSPVSLQRCGPPNSASFRRHAGRLDVNVTWPQGDSKHITNYTVRYKELGSSLWNKSHVASQSRSRCLVEHLKASLVYVVQIQCVSDHKCSQCPWSEAFTVESELTTPPVIVGFKDIPRKNGCRLVSLTWKSSASELHDGFFVMIAKASGESPERINTSRPEIRLILSYSAYQVNISAVNNVSASPAVSHMIPQREAVGDLRLNVTVHSSTSFTIYWKENLIRKYVCFSVEWWKKGQKATHRSFYESGKNYKTLNPSPGLEPYKKYSITLHTRPNKDTCNMKHINNSESTYGTAHFYSVQGSPVSAPTNISSHNVTLDSVELQWSSIPEEDIRGFLLGYIIHYTEYQHRGASTESNITVDPEINSYKLGNLVSGTTYQVQISGFTSAGVGVRSEEILFKTNREGEFNPRGVVTMLAVLTTLLIFGSPVIKRVKVLLWPSIPNPRKSNALQKMDGPCELELLGAIDTLKVEERDTESLQLVEKVAMVPASTAPSMLPLLHHSGDEKDSAGTTCNWRQTDTGGTTGDFMSDEVKTLDTQRPVTQSSPFTFSSEYTTIEMFQQVVPQPAPQEPAAKGADVAVFASRMDYVRQFSTSPTFDSDQSAEQ